MPLLIAHLDEFSMPQFFATCPQGLENLLMAELRDLGALDAKGTRGGVEFTAPDMALAYSVCLHAHLCHRLLMGVKRFKASTPDEVYEQIGAIDWSDHLAADGSLLVESKLRDAELGNPHYVALKVKDAIADQFRAACGTRPSVDTVNPDLRLNLFVHRQSAELSIDLSGGGLRNPQVDTTAHPQSRGSLAAAAWHFGQRARLPSDDVAAVMVLGAADVDLIIGIALMASGLAPGLYQSRYGFERWQGHVPALWKRMRDEAQVAARKVLETGRGPCVVVSDEHNITLQAARQACARLGLAPLIDWSCTPRLRVSAPALQGLAFVPAPAETMPPHHRKRHAQELESGVTRAMRGWTFVRLDAGLTEDADTAWRRRPDQQLSLKRGKNGFQLSRYDGHAVTQPVVTTPYVRPDDPEPTPVVALDPDEIGEGARMLLNRLQKNLKHLGKWARRNQIGCYRLYDADLPEYAAAVDVYHSDQLWAVVQEYAAPATLDAEVAEHRLQEILSMVSQCLELSPQRIMLKQRKRQRGTAQYEKLQGSGRNYVVHEGALKLWVNFTDYLDTGVFLDHRSVRQELGERARDKHVLNLFAYTGVATLHMVAGGARSSTTIDMSKTYLAWAERNLLLNGLQGEAHECVQADCLSWLAEQAANPASKRYGLIFMDPPTFSSSKRMEGVLDVQRDHVSLIRNAVRLLRPGGELYFSNNFRRFQMDHEQLTGLLIEDITARTLPEDFRKNPRIHKCYRITVAQ